MKKKIIKISSEKEETVCPKCGGSNLKTIRYGLLKPMDAKKQEEFDKTSIMGGCMIDGDSPRFYCTDCKESFGKVKTEIE